MFLLFFFLMRFCFSFFFDNIFSNTSSFFWQSFFLLQKRYLREKKRMNTWEKKNFFFLPTWPKRKAFEVLPSFPHPLPKSVVFGFLCSFFFRFKSNKRQSFFLHLGKTKNKSLIKRFVDAFFCWIVFVLNKNRQTGQQFCKSTTREALCFRKKQWIIES